MIPTVSRMVHVVAEWPKESDPPSCLAAIVTGVDYGRSKEPTIYLTVFSPTGSMADQARRATAPPSEWHDPRECPFGQP